MVPPPYTLNDIERASYVHQRSAPVVPKLPNGKQEAQMIALLLGLPTPSDRNWSPRLRSCRAVKPGMVSSINHKTVHRRPKKALRESRRVR